MSPGSLLFCHFLPSCALGGLGNGSQFRVVDTWDGRTGSTLLDCDVSGGVLYDDSTSVLVSQKSETDLVVVTPVNLVSTTAALLVCYRPRADVDVPWMPLLSMQSEERLLQRGQYSVGHHDMIVSRPPEWVFCSEAQDIVTNELPHATHLSGINTLLIYYQ